MTIDYSQIIELIATIIKVAMPIGLIMMLSEWAVKFFMKVVSGRYLKGD